MKPNNKSRSTVGRGMNLGTRCHNNAKAKGGYRRRDKFAKSFTE